MKHRLEGLSDNVSALGSAGLELAKAEAAALSDELRLSGKQLLRVALLFGIGLSLFFWAIAVLVFVGVEVVALWLPRWGAGLVILAVLLAALLVFILVAWKRLKRMESPAATARRRLADHLEWWRRRIVRRDE